MKKIIISASRRTDIPAFYSEWRAASQFKMLAKQGIRISDSVSLEDLMGTYYENHKMDSPSLIGSYSI